MYICNEDSNYVFRIYPRKSTKMTGDTVRITETGRERYYLPIIYCGRVILLSVLWLDIQGQIDISTKHQLGMLSISSYVYIVCIERSACIRIANDIGRIVDTHIVYTHIVNVRCARDLRRFHSNKIRFPRRSLRRTIMKMSHKIRFFVTKLFFIQLIKRLNLVSYYKFWKMPLLIEKTERSFR